MRNLDSRHGPVIPNPSHVGGLLPTASHKNESIHPFRMATTAILHSPPPPESHCRVQRGVLWLSLAAAGSLTTQGTDGYFSDGYGIKAKGRAGVALAEPDDAFGGANNPATIAFVEDRVDFGLDWFTPEREAQRTGSDWRGRRDFSMTTNYWPWWVGGLLLAAVAIAFPLLAAAPLGVSGALARLLRWRSEGADKPQDVNAATVESSPPTPPTTERLADAGGSCEAMTSLSNPAQPGGPDRIANLAFLLAVLVGGGLAGWVGAKRGNRLGSRRSSTDCSAAAFPHSWFYSAAACSSDSGHGSRGVAHRGTGSAAVDASNRPASLLPQCSLASPSPSRSSWKDCFHETPLAQNIVPGLAAWVYRRAPRFRGL